MIAKAVLSGRILAVLTLFLSSFLSLFPARAQSVSMAWSPSLSPNVAGYDVCYGLASGIYTSYVC